MRFDAWGSTNETTQLASIGISDNFQDAVNGTNTHELTLAAGNGLTWLYDFVNEPDGGVVETNYRLFGSVPFGTWTTVQITLNFQQLTCELKINGTAISGFSTLDNSWATGGYPTIWLGVYFASSQASPWEVRFDNVLVDLQ
jgi:hypothetical protein